MTPPPGKRTIKSKADYLEYAEAFNSGNFDKYASYYADDMTSSWPGLTLHGLKAFVDFMAPQRAYVTEEIIIQRLCVDDQLVVVESYQNFRGQPGIEPQMYNSFGEISPGKGPVKHAVLWYSLNEDGLITQLHLDELAMPEGIPNRSEDWDAQKISSKV